MNPVAILVATVFAAFVVLVLVEYVIEKSIDNERAYLAEKLRALSAAVEDENFELMPEHLEELADEIERDERW